MCRLCLLPASCWFLALLFLRLLQNIRWLSVVYSVTSQNVRNQSCFLYISCVFILLNFLSKNNTMNWIIKILVSIWHNVCIQFCIHSFAHLQTHPLNHSHN
jgi:hypothetical protein